MSKGCEYCKLPARLAFTGVIKRPDGTVLDQWMCNMAHSTFYPAQEHVAHLERCLAAPVADR